MVFDLYFLDLRRAGTTVGPYFIQRYTTHMGAGRARMHDKHQKMIHPLLLGGAHHHTASEISGGPYPGIPLPFHLRVE